MPEGEAERDRERSPEEAAERWGPPRPDLGRRRLAVSALAFAAALAGAIFVFGLSLTPDRFLLVLLAPALVIGRGRRYLLDFVPFALLIVLYAESRGLAHALHPSPYYLPQLHLEQFIFGGRIPPVVLQDWLWTGTDRWYDHFFETVTRIHSIVPTMLAFVLWLRRRALFYRFAATMITLSFAGAVTFLLFPAAPPWAAAEQGFIPYVTRLAGAPTSSSALPTGSAPMSVYRWVHQNPYAAIPSLHAGYAFLLFLFVATIVWRTRWRWWVIGIAALYPLLQSFAVVYTANHYVVDLLIGYAYATAAVFGVRRFWRWRQWPE